MRWRKKGLIYVPDGTSWWAKRYAYAPTVVVANGYIRVYYAALDEQWRGRIGYADLDVDAPGRILKVTEEPVLDIGEPGTFDDSGVTPACVLHVKGKKYLYYTGWQRSERVPYFLFTGLAISADDGSFRKVSRVPILDRTDREPFLRSTPTVIEDGGLFRAWYASGLGWISVGGRAYPRYVIRAATSSDGIHWREADCRGLEFQNDCEFGLGRPWVFRCNDVYHMWYSIRSRKAPYRIGYAESTDGTVWQRKDDESGIAASQAGWDSEMICYACVVNVKGCWHMFHNGNQHGASGFGYATLLE